MRVLALFAALVLAGLLGACGGTSTDTGGGVGSGGSDENAWDQMKWDEATWR